MTVTSVTVLKLRCLAQIALLQNVAILTVALMVKLRQFFKDFVSVIVTKAGQVQRVQIKIRLN